MIDPQQLHLLAARQWGYFTARQAVASGFSKDLQRYHVKTGDWQKVDRALYRLPGYPDALEAAFTRDSLRAAGQSEARTVVVSHGSALFYYGLVREQPEQVDLTVSAVRFRGQELGFRLHQEALAPTEYRVCTGFCVTTPLRTLRDMCPDLTLQARWGATLYQAWQQALLTEDEARALAAPAVLETLRPYEGQIRRGQVGEGIRMAGYSMRPGHRSGQERGAAINRSFTLVEMLVVMAVLAILAALLMPALDRALGSARQLACLNNLKQTGYAHTMYADDSAGFLYSNRYWEAHQSLPTRPWADYFMAQGYLPDCRISPDSSAKWYGSVVPGSVAFQCGELPPPSTTYTLSVKSFAGGVNNSFFSYGVRDMVASFAEERVTADGSCVRITSAKSRYPFLADSYASRFGGVQGNWLVFNFGTSGYPLDTHGVLARRHADRANCWFPDNSAAARDWWELQSLPKVPTYPRLIESYPKLD